MGRQPSFHLPLSRSPDQSLRHLLTLAGALLEVFGVVVVTSEAVENLCDARLSFFSLRGCVVSSLQLKAVSVAPSPKLQMMADFVTWGPRPNQAVKNT